MKNRLLLLISVILSGIFAGCQHAPSSKEQTRPTLVGHWVGEVRELDNVVFTRWHMHRKSDGSYTVIFRNFRRDGGYDDNMETGTWKSEGDYYLTTTSTQQIVGGTRPRSVHYVEKYKILNLSADNFSYQDEKSGLVFSVRRVPASYEFPSK